MADLIGGKRFDGTPLGGLGWKAGLAEGAK